jgi:hypothetical protein
MITVDQAKEYGRRLAEVLADGIGSIADEIVGGELSREEIDDRVVEYADNDESLKELRRAWSDEADALIPWWAVNIMLEEQDRRMAELRQPLQTH